MHVETPPGGNVVSFPGDAWSRIEITNTKRFGSYEIVDTLQRGGMGELLLADRHEPDGSRSRVVLKRLLADLLADERYVSMFLVEARVMSRLAHPNIVKVFEAPVIEGKQCLAMEYVHGQNVLQILRRSNSLGTQMPPQVALHIVNEILKGLEYAHTFVLDDGQPLELVHRDVTPGNMLVSFDGDVKITDFGIAKSKMSCLSTTVGIVKGTTRYLSPEQIRGEQASLRSDLFSCASVLVEMLTGVPLFDRGAVPSTLFAIATGQRPDIQRLLPFDAPLFAAIIERTLSIDPKARFGSANELREALEGASFEIGHKIDRAGLGAFLHDLFPEVHAPLAAFGGAERSTSGLDNHDLTYLLEIRDPIQWASEKGELPMASTPELRRAREALRLMASPGAKPLDAALFSHGKKIRVPPPPPPPESDPGHLESEPELTVREAFPPASMPEPCATSLDEEVWTSSSPQQRPFESELPTEAGVRRDGGAPPLPAVVSLRPPTPAGVAAVRDPRKPPTPASVAALRDPRKPPTPAGVAAVRDPRKPPTPAGVAAVGDLARETRKPPTPDVVAAMRALTWAASSSERALAARSQSPDRSRSSLSSPEGSVSSAPVSAANAPSVRLEPPVLRPMKKAILFVAGVLCGIFAMRAIPAHFRENPSPSTELALDEQTSREDEAGEDEFVANEEAAPTVPSTLAPDRSGEPASRTAPAPSMTRDGTLELRRPKGAHVVLDGAMVTKRVPFSDLKVASGQHRITIITGRAKKSFSLTVEPGSHVDVSRLPGAR